MKTKLITVVSAMAVSWLALSFANTAMAQKSGGAESGAKPPAPATTPSGTGQAAKGSGGATVATPITPEEAAKKYPAPKGGAYPPGERDPHKPSGQISSPYPPHDVYDCSNIAHGGLVLDTHVKKVFVRP